MILAILSLTVLGIVLYAVLKDIFVKEKRKPHLFVTIECDASPALLAIDQVKVKLDALKYEQNSTNRTI